MKKIILIIFLVLNLSCDLSDPFGLQEMKKKDSSDSCCKHCGSTSTPCGDSCISNSYTCNQPNGCVHAIKS